MGGTDANFNSPRSMMHKKPPVDMHANSNSNKFPNIDKFGRSKKFLIIDF